MPCRQPRRQEVRRRVGRDGRGELRGIDVDQRDAQDVGVGDAEPVERDVDPSRPVDHRLQVLVQRLLVERVDLGGLGRPAGGDDLLGEHLDRVEPATGEEDAAPSAANARATAPPIAPPAP